MKSDIFTILIMCILVSVGNVLLNDHKRRNLRATLTRHRRRHRTGSPYYGGETGGGDDSPDRSGDDWGGGDWGGGDGGGGDGGGGGSD
jgi:hypothetical protein